MRECLLRGHSEVSEEVWSPLQNLTGQIETPGRQGKKGKVQEFHESPLVLEKYLHMELRDIYGLISLL